MHNIGKYIIENRKEAYDIIKAHGGKIEFVNNIIHNDPDDYTQDDWRGDINTEEVPCVVLGLDSIVDCCVLSVKCADREPNIEFLGYDVETNECIGWCSDATCCNNTENAIYEFIGNLK